MSYNKKIFNDGGIFTASDANFIQSQYDAAITELKKSQAEFSLALKVETFEGNGIKNFFHLNQDLVTQPIISVKRLADSFYTTETVALDNSKNWKYEIGNPDVYQLSGSTLLTGEYVRIAYLLKIYPHAETHSYIPPGQPTDGKDELKIGDINGYTKEEVNEKIQEIGTGITSDQANTIATTVKGNANVAACIRTVSNIGAMLPGEICILTP